MSLSKYSRVMRYVFQMLLMLLPIGIVYFWLTYQTPYAYLSNFGIVQINTPITILTKLPLSFLTRIAAIIVSLIFSFILMRALSLLIQLFGHYARNEIFTACNVQIYRQLGHCVFYWVFGGIVYEALMTIVISMNNPPGERMLFVSFTGVDALTLLVGVIILGISRVMREGQHLADENEYII